MKIFAVAFFVASICVLTAAPSLAQEQANSPAWSEGAEVLKIPAIGFRIDTYSGIVFAQPKEQNKVHQLKMTIMSPRTEEKKPAVIYFPGGGFTSADNEKFIEARTALAKAGFVVAGAQYRAVPNQFPAIVEDAKAAVRFLRAHAEEFGVDTNRIGILGDSAGGYLAEMVGTINGEKGWDVGDYLGQNSDVQAVISIYGISDLTCIGEGLGKEIEEIHKSPAVTEALLVHGPAFGSFPGASIMSDKEKALNASPIGHVDGSEPPFLLMHGTADTLVSPMQSKHLYEAMKAKGVDVRYILLEGAKHGDSPWFQDQVINIIVEWFKQKLGASEATVEGAGSNL